MPKPSLAVDLRMTQDDTRYLEGILDDAKDLPPKFQFYVAELTLLRLSQLLEARIISVASKLVCGASYYDGTPPRMMCNARSIASAKVQMQVYGRPKPVNLKWSKVPSIKKNVVHVLDPAEHFLISLDKHSNFLSDLTGVRNYIAHRNASTRERYREVIKRHYGAYAKISPGVLLMSEKLMRPALLRRYVVEVRAMIGDAIKS